MFLPLQVCNLLIRSFTTQIHSFLGWSIWFTLAWRTKTVVVLFSEGFYISLAIVIVSFKSPVTYFYQLDVSNPYLLLMIFCLCANCLHSHHPHFHPYITIFSLVCGLLCLCRTGTTHLALLLIFSANAIPDCFARAFSTLNINI